MSDLDRKTIEYLTKQVADLKQTLSLKDQEISLYKQELLKFSHQLDGVLIQIGQDVELLKKIQKILIPTELPEFPGFEFSRRFVFGSKFGGDYFDIFEHEDKLKFGILLSSSSGYAMSALFLSLILKISHLMEAKKGLAPQKVLEQIGTELKTAAQGKDQTQAFYAVVDRRSLAMEFCAVGRINGFLIVPGQPLQVISSDSVGMGAQSECSYKSIRLDLEPKSRLVLVTEGILDVLSVEDIGNLLTQLGTQSQVHDVRNELLLQCQIKSGLETPIRDQTVVVMDVKDRVIKLAK